MKKRLLASFMSLCMILSLLPVSALAAPEDGGGSASGGKVVSDQATVTSEDGLVTFTKTVEKVEGSANTFEITLNVEADDQVTITPAESTDIVLVIDGSGSMDGDRLETTKTAAKNFADKVLNGDTDVQNKIAVVSYAEDFLINAELSDDYDTIEAAVENISADGGTNIQGGIYAAHNILRSSTADHQVIVVLSDGDPSYSYRAIITGMWDGCYTIGSLHDWNDLFGGQLESVTDISFDYDAIIGDSASYVYTNWGLSAAGGSWASVTVTCDHSKTDTKNLAYYTNNGDPTIQEAAFAKDDGIKIYSIYLGEDSDENAIYTMRGVASGDEYFQSTSDLAALGQMFEEIASSITITTSTDAGSIVDPMGQFISLDQSGLADNEAITINDKGFSWNLSKVTPSIDSNNTKTYTLTYQVTLDVEADDFASDTPYHTNGDTVLTYYVGGEEKTLTIEGDKTPTVSSLAAYTVTYDGNDATTGTAPADSSSPYEDGSTVTVLGNTGGLDMDKAVFLGWSTTQSELVTTKDAEDALTILNAGATFVINGNTTLYAVWAQDEDDDGQPDYSETYSLTYDANGGNTTGVPTDSTEYQAGAEVTLATGSDSNLGTANDNVVFVGWSESNTHSVSSPAQTKPGTQATVTMGSADKTVYAVWAVDADNDDTPDYEDPVSPDPTQVTVTYQIVGGTWSDGSTADKTVTLTLEEGSATLGDTIPTGMQPSLGYLDEGTWNTTIDAATPITQDATYTYTFEADPDWTTAGNTIYVHLDDGTTEDFYALGGELTHQVRIFSDKYTLGDYIFCVADLTENLTPPYSEWVASNLITGITAKDISKIELVHDNVSGSSEKIVIPMSGNQDYSVDVKIEDGNLHIYITKIQETPEQTYALIYHYNNASEGTLANTETDDQKYAAGATVTLKTDVNDQYDTEDDGVVVVGWTETQSNYTKSNPATVKPTVMVTQVTFSDDNITVYAVWAQDADDDGIPDYNDPNFESQTVYVYAKPTGSGEGGALTEAEKEYLEDTYHLTLNSDGYCVLGKLTNVLLPKASEQDDSVNYFEQYEAVITAALEDSFTAHEDVPTDVDTLIDTLEWNHLGVANGAEGYDESEAPSDTLCWHLDGDLDINAKYDLTFHANGGYFGSESTNTTNKITGLLADTYELNNNVLTNYAEPTHGSVDGVEVLFVGWTTEEPSTENAGRIYQAGDTDVPATVSSVIVSADTQLWAVWGYNEDADTGDNTPDVNQIVITPADITIYTGGEGYSGIVIENEEDQLVPAEDGHGFPEPGYFITLPTNLNEAIVEALKSSGNEGDVDENGIANLSKYLDFTYNDSSSEVTREWELSTYDENASVRLGDGRYVYRLGDSLTESGAPIAIRISITDSEGNYVGSDTDFKPSLASGLYEEYSMIINPGDLNRQYIQLSLKDGNNALSALEDMLAKCHVFVKSGTLTVRGVNDDQSNAIRDIRTEAPTETVSRITAHVETGTSYNINESPISVSESNDIKLLVDTLTTNDSITEQLEEAATSALTAAGIDTTDLTFTEFRYLDLVDNSNGNAYVTLDEDQTIDIYWPNPNEDSEAYYVIHFDGLDRNFSLVSLKDQLAKSNIAVYSNVAEEHSDADNAVKELTVDQHNNLVFATGTFSPFVVAYRSSGSTTPDTVTVTFRSGSHGDFGSATSKTVEVTKGGRLPSGQVPTVYPDSNYSFAGWNVGGTVYSTSNLLTRTFDSDTTITAQYTYTGSDGGSSGGGNHDNDRDPTGSLTISLGGSAGNDEFTFTVILTDEDGDDLEYNYYYNGDYTGTIGSGGEITLENGEEIVIRNLPEGTRYEVILETPDGYTYTADGEEGIIHTGMNEAEFTATRAVTVADPSVTGVARWLNTSDHMAYLSGYPDNTFGPDRSMTRAEVAQMFYALLQDKDVAVTRTFSDVPADAWYAAAVNTLASLGMVSGDENGNYRPNDPITRAEFCVIALAFAYEPENASCSFTDVSWSDWFYPYVAQAASYGWIGGYTNGAFGPNDPITRAQVTTIVNNMLGRAADRDYVDDYQDELVQFTDLSSSHWAYYQIMEATNAHDYTKRSGTENWR